MQTEGLRSNWKGSTSGSTTMTDTCATGNERHVLVTRATSIIQTLSNIPNIFLAHINQI